MEPAAPATRAVGGTVGGTLERWFEVTSVIPLAGFGLLHVGSYARVLFGDGELGGRASPPGALLVAEALLVWLPLAFHAAAGSGLWLRRRRSLPEDPSARATLALHRLTGFLLGAFLVDHFVRFRWPIVTGVRYPAEALGVLAGELSRTTFGLPLIAGFHALGVLALAYHLGYGLFRIAARTRFGAHGATRAACVALGLLTALLGALTVVRLATG